MSSSGPQPSYAFMSSQSTNVIASSCMLIVGTEISLFCGHDVVLSLQSSHLYVKNFRDFENFIISMRKGYYAHQHVDDHYSGVVVCKQPNDTTSPFHMPNSLVGFLSRTRNMHDLVRIGPFEIFLYVSVSELIAAFLQPFTAAIRHLGNPIAVTVPTLLGWVARAQLVHALSVHGIAVRRLYTTSSALAAAFLGTPEGRHLLLKHEGSARILILEVTSEYVAASVVQIEIVLSNLPLPPAYILSEEDGVDDNNAVISFAPTLQLKASSSAGKQIKMNQKLTTGGVCTSLSPAEMRHTSISSMPLIRIESLCGSATGGLQGNREELQGIMHECIQSAISAIIDPEKANASPSPPANCYHHGGNNNQDGGINALVLWMGEESKKEAGTNKTWRTSSMKDETETMARDIMQDELKHSFALPVEEALWMCLAPQALEKGSVALETKRVFECPCKKIGLRLCEKTPHKTDGFISMAIWLVRSLDVHVQINMQNRPEHVGVYLHRRHCDGKMEDDVMIGSIKVPEYAKNLELQIVEDRNDGRNDESIGVILGIPWWPADEGAPSEGTAILIFTPATLGMFSVKVNFVYREIPDDIKEMPLPPEKYPFLKFVTLFASLLLIIIAFCYHYLNKII